jgi:alanine racemase
MSRKATATIHLQALQHNLQQARAALSGSTRVVAVIKADGYGHGLLTVARALHQADLYAVGCLDEAAVLRQHAVDKPILLLEGFEGEGELRALAQLRLSTVLHSEQQWGLLQSMVPEQPLSVWLKIDSGMGRLGFSVERAEALLPQLQAHPSVAEVVLISHFANADQPGHPLNEVQQRTFAGCAGGRLPRSLCNSAALLSNPAVHHQFVRPGIMLYGGSSLAGRSAESLGLKPAMTLQAPLIAIKQIAAGATVGYGSGWRAERPTRLGVVAIGYGHGYPRRMPTGTPVLVRGRRAALVGRVSMDMLTVDLTDLPEAEVGDAVTLWGEGLPVDEIAQQAGTISYELLCQLTSRVERVSG